MFENIRLSFRGIWNHKLRSVLTMLGIIIGIAAIITIVSTIKGTNDQIKQNLIGSGTNVVTVQLSAKNGYYDPGYSETPDGIMNPSENDRETFLALDGVSDVSFYVYRQNADSVYYQNSVFSGQIYGIDSHYLSVNGYRLSYGRGFVDGDYAGHRKVLLIDTDTVTTLFAGEYPIGCIVEMQGEPFTVVGVVEKTSDASPSINSISDYWMYGGNSNGTIFNPDASWSVLYRFDEPCTLAVRAASTDDMAGAGSGAASVMNESFVMNSEYEYEANDLLQQASELQSLSNSTNTQLLWIAGISLLVGGIGVMNIMLVSVTERTREIGLKKALGAKRRVILWQFLTEAAVLTSLGGLLGVGAGIGLAKLLSGVVGTPASISVPACLIAVVFSMVIGVVFGLIPAFKASKLNPIEALRRE